jgi:diacylglycerol kinase (ATP)
VHTEPRDGILHTSVLVAKELPGLESARRVGEREKNEAMKRPFEFTGRIRSFRHAGHGALLTLRSQHNAWVHAAATVAVVIAGFVFQVTRIEWCLLVFACAAVWTAEALNTAFEFLADATTKEFHPVIKQAKDVAAGAVLITAVAAAVVGAMVFLPHLASTIGAP